MKKEIYEKLKNSKAIIKIDADQFISILVNADGHLKPKMYNFVYSNQHNKPLITEITDEKLLLAIAEGNTESK